MVGQIYVYYTNFQLTKMDVYRFNFLTDMLLKSFNFLTDMLLKSFNSLTDVVEEF